MDIGFGGIDIGNTAHVVAAVEFQGGVRRALNSSISDWRDHCKAENTLEAGCTCTSEK